MEKLVAGDVVVIRHHAVTKSGWKRGFYRDAVDGVDRSKACQSITPAYPADGIDHDAAVIVLAEMSRCFIAITGTNRRSWSG